MVTLWIGVGALAGFGVRRLVKVLGGEVRTLKLMFMVEAMLFLIANIPPADAISLGVAHGSVRCDCGHGATGFRHISCD